MAVAGLVVYTVGSVFAATSGAYTMWTLGAFGPPTSPLGVYLVGEAFGTALGITGLVRCWIRRRRGDAGRTALCWTAGVLLAWAVWAIGLELLWLVVF